MSFVTKTLRNYFWCFTLFLIACTTTPATPTPSEPTTPTPTPPSDVAATITVSNLGASEWVIEKVEGDAVSSLGNNTEWTLTVGKRYQVINPAYRIHPFSLIDASGNLLLTQGPIIEDGSFSDNADVNAVFDGESFSFTLTQDLADLLDRYYCNAPHPLMQGNITVN